MKNILNKGIYFKCNNRYIYKEQEIYFNVKLILRELVNSNKITYYSNSKVK